MYMDNSNSTIFRVSKTKETVYEVSSEDIPDSVKEDEIEDWIKDVVLVNTPAAEKVDSGSYDLSIESKKPVKSGKEGDTE